MCDRSFQPTLRLMMYKHYIQIDQIQREIEAEVALNQKSYIQSEAPTGLYSKGWFDGLIGDKPRYRELEPYCLGYKERKSGILV